LYQLSANKHGWIWIFDRLNQKKNNNKSNEKNNKMSSDTRSVHELFGVIHHTFSSHRRSVFRCVLWLNDTSYTAKGLASVRSCTLALLLELTSGNCPPGTNATALQESVKKHFYLKNFYDCDLSSDVVMSAVLICKWTLSYYDDDDDEKCLKSE